MKRFTETTKWRDPWFRRLSPTAKLLWQYLTDNCSCIGLIELDLEAAKFDIGASVNEKHLTELSDRVQALGNGKYFIPKFIPFQYGAITSTCPAHKPIIKAILHHQLIITEIGYQYPIARDVNTLVDMEKEKEKEKEWKEGVQGEIQAESDIAGSTVLPVVLNCDVFREAWIRWLQHLKQKRKPPTIHAQDLQLARMAQIGVSRAVSAINHSIEKNWQSIYEQQTDSISGSNHAQGHRRNTGAEQRQVGIPEIKRDLTTGELVELQQQQLRKEREQREQAAKDKMATDQAGA